MINLHEGSIQFYLPGNCLLVYYYYYFSFFCVCSSNRKRSRMTERNITQEDTFQDYWIWKEEKV